MAPETRDMSRPRTPSRFPSLDFVPRYRVYGAGMPDLVDARHGGAKNDLARTPSIIWLWGVPVVMVITASALNGVTILSLQ